MWQKCPICNGSGVNPNYLSNQYQCKTCKGEGIISEVTGLPPISQTKGYDFRDAGDFRDNCEQFEDK